MATQREMADAQRSVVVETPSFDRVYDDHFDYIWRVARRLGVDDAAVLDAVQDVFLVVHRRLGDFEGRSSVKTWLYSIALHVVRDYRRREHRKGGLAPLPEDLAAPVQEGPHERAETSEAVELLHTLLDDLDDDKREAFVMVELEQLTVPEVAATLECNPNTVYSRLRAARAQFDKALGRHRARQTGGHSG